ncbi:MAG: FmdB family zinc ribbon protein [Cyanobium sp.]|jgi:putative FmdB family regulatory protein
MPVYEFACSNGCETYEIWRTIDQRSCATECPACGQPGSRIFSPPVTLSGPLRLKQENRDPQVVRKIIGNKGTKQRLRESTGSRPWMLKRDC